MENNLIFFCGIALFFIKFVSFFSLTRKITQPSRYFIPSSTPVILKIQEYESWYLDVFFSGFSSCVNSVPFHTAFIPLLFWTGHCKLARQMTLLMAFSDYAGNFSKDVVSAPRPSAPTRFTATKDVADNAIEYGLPSPHTFNTLCLSGYLLHYLIGLCGSDDLITQAVGFSVVCSVLGLIGLGKMYLGMHSAVDSICGMALGIGILAIWLSVSGYIDHFSVSGQTVISLWTALSFLLLFAYPTPELSPSFEFKTAISGVALGIGIGVHQTFNQFHHQNAARVFSPELSVPAFVGRMLLGIPIILMVKFCCEALAKWILPVLANTVGIPVRSTSCVPALLSPDRNDREPKHQIKQESSYIQQKAVLLSKQVFFDVGTGIRLFQYTGLACAYSASEENALRVLHLGYELEKISLVDYPTT